MEKLLRYEDESGHATRGRRFQVRSACASVAPFNATQRFVTRGHEIARQAADRSADLKRTKKRVAVPGGHARWMIE